MNRTDQRGPHRAADPAPLVACLASDRVSFSTGAVHVIRVGRAAY